MFTTKTFAALLFAAAAVCAAPTKSTASSPSGTVTLTGVTHSVVAGRGGQLVFDPENVVADAGDVVEWHFLPKNHSVAQSNFKNPCVPDPAAGASSFFSGFVPVASGQSDKVFRIVVEDSSKPIWYYCAQTTGNHCQKGMAGVINQKFDSPATLAAYKLAAVNATTVVPEVVALSALIPNPNPQSGF